MMRLTKKRQTIIEEAVTWARAMGYEIDLQYWRNTLNGHHTVCFIGAVALANGWEPYGNPEPDFDKVAEILGATDDYEVKRWGVAQINRKGRPTPHSKLRHLLKVPASK